MQTGRHVGKVAVVTGAAHGIGAATVRQLLAEGASVMASDIDEDGLSAFVAETDVPDRLTGQVADVGRMASVHDLIDATIDRFGQLDVVVNNAGRAVYGTVEQLSEDTWRRVIDVDLSSIFFSAKAALPHLRRTRGNIVNIASISGLGATRSLSAYYAAKGGVVNFTRYLAIEHGPEGIRVNAVCPGPVNTHPGLMDVPPIHDEYLANIPLKRLGAAEDIAHAVCFLSSSDASYISGHNLVVDGALTAWTGEPDLGPSLQRRAAELRAQKAAP